MRLQSADAIASPSVGLDTRLEPDPVAPGLDTSHFLPEPTHIQSHGALLAALLDGGLVTHASANLHAILGRSAEAVLGQPLERAIGEAACRVLRDITPPDRIEPRQRTYLLPGPDGGILQLRAYRSGRHLCIDIEPMSEGIPRGLAVSTLQSVLETFKDATTRGELCDLAVRGLMTITGYDRVMAYRFDKDGHGEVIAERCIASLDPYLGLRYPASDIPPQIRLHHFRQRVREIADSSHRPVMLLRDPALDDDQIPLDLTHCALRRISATHCRYMRNIKIAASLTVGLANGHDLWGMLVCHHTTPRAAGPELRAVADIIGQVVSLLLGGLGEAEALAARFQRMSILRALAGRLAAPVPLADAFAAAESELLALVGATGAVLRLADKVFCVGRTPSPPDAERALTVLHPHAAGEVLAVDDLGLRYPDLADCIPEGSGALLLPLAGGADDAILWFRPELAQTIVWGNPVAHVTSDKVTERISPRASFAAWKEIVTGHSAPWTEADLALARDLRGAIKVEVARRTKAELFELRHYDPLTGLPNRTLLQERLAEAGKETETVVTLLFLSLDETKEINETMGYAAGDELLVEVARRLVAAAGPQHLAARLGGTEFVVLCRGLQPDAAAELGEEIRRAIAAPYELYGRLFHLASGIGIAVVDQSSMLDPASAADFAMQEAIIMIGAKQRAESQRQKMETLGRTMGGVAHEINNMLQPVTLLIQDVIDKELVLGEGRQHLDIVLDCSMKARQIIGDMLAFSRPTASSTELHDPVLLLHDSLPIVRQAIPPGLVLSIRIEGCLPQVKINRTTFVQILLNLTINAAAAMNGKGELTIALEEVVRGSGEAGVGQPTSFVRMRVIDDGCGMDKATLDRAFEPFFTTKPVGQGTGLGLPVVYGLVREIGATIVLTSEPDCGTTVTILIPGKNGEADNGCHIDH